MCRDGVSESQFSQVLNVELNQIIKAYQYMDQGPIPKFTVIIAQKNHHTKLFQENTPDNVPPGTVVDSGIVHPRQYDFYMYAHAGPIGTSRPTHYHVLLDEIGFLPDDVQKLVLSLSYVYQRSTTAISVGMLIFLVAICFLLHSGTLYLQSDQCCFLFSQWHLSVMLISQQRRWASS
jgi:eukaryotic translation initiation factor 2C